MPAFRVLGLMCLGSLLIAGCGDDRTVVENLLPVSTVSNEEATALCRNLLDALAKEARALNTATNLDEPADAFDSLSGQASKVGANRFAQYAAATAEFLRDQKQRVGQGVASTRDQNDNELEAQYQEAKGLESLLRGACTRRGS
jgi:hypothetical protein